MAKHDLLKLPDDFEGNMRALLATPRLRQVQPGVGRLFRSPRRNRSRVQSRSRRRRRAPTRTSGTSEEDEEER